LLRQWAQEAPEREFKDLAKEVIDRTSAWHHHLDNRANRNLSMSGETSVSFFYSFRSQFRRARRAAGIKGQICKMMKGSDRRYYEPDPISRATYVFSREADGVREIDKHVALHVASLIEYGRPHEDFWGYKTLKWVETMSGTAMAEDGTRENILNCSVPLAARLAIFKRAKRDGLRRAA
jgi:hypothetical protein